jgi:hypothetical protein
MSSRDIEAAFGVTRRQQSEALLIAEIPEDEFESLLEGDNPPSVSELVNMARRRAGKATDYTRRCPHCRKPLRIEDAR